MPGGTGEMPGRCGPAGQGTRNGRFAFLPLGNPFERVGGVQVAFITADLIQPTITNCHFGADEYTIWRIFPRRARPDPANRRSGVQILSGPFHN